MAPVVAADAYHFQFEEPERQPEEEERRPARDRPAQRRFVPLLVTLLWHGAIARSRRKNVT